jgi:hypothetical protein
VNKIIFAIINVQPLLLLGFTSNEQSLITTALVTSFDGTQVTIDDLHINGNTEITLFTKPAITETAVVHKAKTERAITEIPLKNNPNESQTGPFQISGIKNILVKDPSTEYTYQDTDSSPKTIYLEVTVDGTPYLARKAWKVQGTDTQTHKKRTLELHIIREITVTDKRQKESPGTKKDEKCVCPPE